MAQQRTDDNNAHEASTSRDKKDAGLGYRYSDEVQWVLDHPELPGDVILAAIERELDQTGPDSPYRSARQRLRRVKKRIIQRRKGRDPVVFATGRKGNPNSLREEERRRYTLRKKVNLILNELDKEVM